MGNSDSLVAPNIRTIPDETECTRPLITAILQENQTSDLSAHAEEREIPKKRKTGCEKSVSRRNLHIT